MNPVPITSASCMMPGRVAIHLMVPAAVSTESAMAAVTGDERIRANRFHFAEDATRWISYRAQMREILGRTIGLPPAEVPLVISAQGKPLLAPPFDTLHFNLSHCPDLALLGISQDGPVGIDLESVERAVELIGCESNFCHPDEIASLPMQAEPRATRLLEIWTAKEAILKAFGTGLIHPPESIRLILMGRNWSAAPDSTLPGIESQQIHVLSHPRLDSYRAVVSTPASVSLVEFQE